MNKINIMKTMFLLFFVFISACGSCGFSEKCYREKERERIINMTKEEKEKEKQDCINHYNYMINITDHEKKKCNFWSCNDGKEEWRKRLKSCIWRLENIR